MIISVTFDRTPLVHLRTPRSDTRPKHQSDARIRWNSDRHIDQKRQLTTLARTNTLCFGGSQSEPWLIWRPAMISKWLKTKWATQWDAADDAKHASARRECVNLRWIKRKKLKLLERFKKGGRKRKQSRHHTKKRP